MSSFIDTHSRPQIQGSVSNTFIVMSLLFALIMNGLPLEGIWRLLRPDFVALVLVYWCIHKPWRIGIGLSWTVGIIADVADASLFGQHALAYSVLAFGGLMLHRRLQMFNLRQQTIQVFAILVLTYAMYALVHWQLNGRVVWLYFLGCITTTALWIPLNLLFQIVRQRYGDRERRHHDRLP